MERTHFGIEAMLIAGIPVGPVLSSKQLELAASV